MATATHPTPSVDITPADDMDLHSDNGAFEYNDGDIDLDLEPPPSYGPDDDVSINDAASVSGMDAQAGAGGDNDDYMVDQEDVIEEDYGYRDDDGDTIAEQSVAADNMATQTQEEIQDEDLLDYSDQEDGNEDTVLGSPWQQHHDSMEDEPDQTEEMPGQNEDVPVQEDIPTQEDMPTQEDVPAQEDVSAQEDASTQQDEIPADLQALMTMAANRKSQSPLAHPENVPEASPSANNHESPTQPQSADPSRENVQTDGEGGVMLQSQEEYASAETSHSDVAHPSQDHHEHVQDSENQGDDSFELRPVTVNWMGEELWLFKQHDYENSGDWLLEDISVVKASLSTLFQACRSAVGEEALQGMEIGFRFEHFENMELFEENTACVAVSLERLLSYYHSLHAQDGNNTPDSFYITLMYRPRFATLLADIARCADQGRGYSGLEAAIAAGETHFNSASISLPVENLNEWESDGQEQEQDQSQDENQDQEHVDDEEREHERHASEREHEENQSNPEDVENEKEQNHAEDEIQQEAEVSIQMGDQAEFEHEQQVYVETQSQQDGGYEHDHESGDDSQDAHEEGGVEIHENEEAAAAAVVETEQVSSEGHQEDKGEGHVPPAPSSSEASTNPPEVVEYPEPAQSQSDERTEAELEARRLQEQGDIIDYSDEEDEESDTVEVAEQASHTEVPPSPTTVQGDESSNAERQSSIAESPITSKPANAEHDETSLDTTEEPDAAAEHGQAEGNEDEQAYQDYVQAPEGGGTFDGFEADEVGKEAADFQYDGDANQDYGEYEYQDLEQQAELELANGEEFNGGEDATAYGGEGFTEANDFLELDPAQWTVDQELDQDFLENTTTGHDDGDAQGEEDGGAAPPANATSPAADPTTASSTDVYDVSSQGHKRSIDEAGYGMDIAPDSIDAKRARV
ncbi:hypothetical protein ACJQWK_06428 [Exserohilum turcicum]|uniref:Uncharacterized protein n=1 Tax=Exserohilum turcicum (strain 28A) TaxID=671987 RepID=R0JWH3_EXST2|nr:uncharacterized protein SETTUDRAFT_154878 [Exserohilum turcica Et28A]EOA85308.1 hypothetical protein SETTUDRAFT_154878 [Exserohilum turcica Et28A]